MKWKRVSIFALSSVVVFLAACTAPMPAPSSPMLEAPAEASTVSSKYNSARAVERPGLGTGWGEEVSSTINYTKYERSGAKPVSLDVIYYNDKKGVEAMSAGIGRDSEGLQKSKNGLVEWGVKSGWGYAKNVRTSDKRFVVGLDSNWKCTASS